MFLCSPRPCLTCATRLRATSKSQRCLKEIGDVKCAVDFREILVWREDSAERRRVKDIAAGLNKDDVINLQFTSGTTGLPKAVSLTHRNLLNNGISIGEHMRLTPSDILCNVPPLFHCFGLVLGNLAAWTHGASIVYPSQIFDPRAIVDALVAERCTALHGVPTHFLGVLAEVRARREAGENMDMSTLRTGIAAGTSIPIELMKRLIADLNLTELTVAYGMTETRYVVSSRLEWEMSCRFCPVIVRYLSRRPGMTPWTSASRPSGAFCHMSGRKLWMLRIRLCPSARRARS